MSTFDFPEARLTGLHLNSVTSPLSRLLGKSDAIDSLNLFGIMNTESQIFPLQDFGLAFVGDYTLFHSITLGGGVFLQHLFSVNDAYTTPENNFNRVVDTATGDSVYLTFKATKIMGRATLDPKPLMKQFIPEGFMKLFGENDLKIYSEIGVLGLKDYPIYYSELFRRVPRMIGFDFPTFKVFDVLAGEVEWYYWNYANSYSDYLFQNLIPRPDDIKPGFDYKQNTLKWSIYGKRHIGNHFSIIGQVAYDHMRLEQNMYVQSIMYNGDAMQKHGDWAWILKTQFDL